MNFVGSVKTGIISRAFGQMRLAVAIISMLALLVMPGSLKAQATKAGKDDRIKVGVFVSLYSAKGPSWWTSGEIGWDHVGIASRYSDRSKYELFALVDPGTEDNSFVKQQLERYNFSDTVLDASKVEDLKKVDIMLSGNWQVNIEWQVIDAVIEAVKSGVHLVNFEHFGLIRPAYATGFQATKATWASHLNTDIRNHPEEVEKYKQKMTELFGLKNPRFVWHVEHMKWKVNTKNPIFAFFGNGAITGTCGINGLVGDYVQDQPFELVDSQIIDQWDGRTVTRQEIDPFSIYRCGKGLAVNISIVGDFKNMGFEVRDDFVKYCADWILEHGDDKDFKVSRPALGYIAQATKAVKRSSANNQELISKGLSISGDYSTAQIERDFGLPHHTEKIGQVAIWYYQILDGSLIPLFIKDGVLIAYGESFFQTGLWDRLTGSSSIKPEQSGDYHQDNGVGIDVLPEKEKTVIRNLRIGDIVEVNEIRYTRDGDSYEFENKTTFYRYDGIKLIRIN